MKKRKHDSKKILSKENKADRTKLMKKSRSTKDVLVKKDFTQKKSRIVPYIAAAFTAILIGLFLGLMMLNMFTKKEDHAHTGNYQPVAVHEETNDTEQVEKDKIVLKQMNAYVLQLGVFLEKENANNWSDTYQVEGFPSINFERENQYFLFAGIAHTEEKAKEFAAQLLKDDIEVYVKEWTTNEIKIALTEEESEWLKLFQEQWGKTLQTLGTEEKILFKEWDNLVANYPLKSVEITQLVKAIQLFSENEIENEFELQHHLLNMWKVYEENFNGN